MFFIVNAYVLGLVMLEEEDYCLFKNIDAIGHISGRGLRFTLFLVKVWWSSR